MQTRLLIAIVLSASVLLLWSFYYFPPKDKSYYTQKQQYEKKEDKNMLSKKVYVSQDDLKLSSPLMELYLSPTGEIKSLLLNKYLALEDKNKGEKIDLVFSASTQELMPLEITLFKKKLKLKRYLYKKEKFAEFVYYLPYKEYEYYEYIEVIKRIKLDKPSKYLINIETMIKNNSNRDIVIPADKSLCFSWSGNYSDIIKESSFKIKDLLVSIGSDSKLKRVRVVNDKKEDIEGGINWSALISKYFTVAFLPQTTFYKVNFINELGITQMIVTLPTIKIAPFETYTTSLNIYAGPIIYKNLAELKKNKLEKLSGMNLLTRGILWLLNWFYSFLHNYGLAIILLSLVIKIVLYPLSAKSLKSMKELQKLQPIISKLREKYKHDNEAFNREMILLYKRYKVNPFGGCLPLLLQLPIFWGLYTTLTLAIELRGAKFILWIKDLSSIDPYLILPILMGVSMFLTQKLTPQPDPKSAKLAYIMTIFFTFIFMRLPSGLVLYWLGHNILSIIEQKFLYKKFDSKKL